MTIRSFFVTEKNEIFKKRVFKSMFSNRGFTSIFSVTIFLQFYNPKIKSGHTFYVQF